jgi:hypothetical protein
VAVVCRGGSFSAKTATASATAGESNAMADRPPPSENRLREVIIAVMIPVVTISLLALIPALRELDAIWKGVIFVAAFAGSIWFIAKKKRKPPRA